MNDILKQTLLYDFYGELLTEHQKEIYEQVVLEDYSLSEVAEAAGISRQGVHDMIRRCTRSLENYENRLRLVERFIRIKDKVHTINQLLESYDDTGDREVIPKVRQLSSEILEEL